MVSYLTQNYSSLKKSTWAHILIVGQTWSNVLKKTCIIWYGSLQPTPLKEKFCQQNSYLRYGRDEDTGSAFGPPAPKSPP